MYNIGDYVNIRDDLVVHNVYNVMIYTEFMHEIKKRYITYKITNRQRTYFGCVYEINHERSNVFFTDEMLEPAHYDKFKKFLEEI